MKRKTESRSPAQIAAWNWNTKRGWVADMERKLHGIYDDPAATGAARTTAHRMAILARQLGDDMKEHKEFT